MKHALAWLVAWLPCLALALDGRALVEDSVRRHALPPFVEEELVLVTSDPLGRYSLRTLRHTRQRDERRLVVTTPPELRGTTIALPAPGGDELPLFGSGFRLGDLQPEPVGLHDYAHVAEHLLARQPHHVVEARRPGQAHPDRRLYLRQDNLFVSRVDHLDAAGQPVRRQSFRDPQPDENGIWRPGMILMEDLRDGRRSLLKIERRVHAAEAGAP